MESHNLDGPHSGIFAAVELSKRSPALGLVIDRRQNMDRLVDAADLGHGLCQLGRAVANLESPHLKSPEPSRVSMTQRAEARRPSTAEQRGAGVTGHNGGKRRR